ncbi:MAG TPA: hypothetical protein VLA89_19785 [Gemmatimonadales bacterium]|nr:hypothetical protein [Gemmatimonadales bacterium]
MKPTRAAAASSTGRRRAIESNCCRLTNPERGSASFNFSIFGARSIFRCETAKFSIFDSVASSRLIVAAAASALLPRLGVRHDCARVNVYDFPAGEVRI